jgi:hypothetical protein
MTAPLMRCFEARPYLSAYVDGEVDAGLAERIYEHLASCADCRRTVAKYRAVDALIGQLPAPGPSPEVLDRVLAAASSVNKERAVRESLRRPEKPLAPRSLPAFILADTNLAAPVPIRQAVSQPRLSWTLARALPGIAALLIITLTLVSFRGLRGQNSTVVHPTPDRSPASEVALTYRQVFENSAGKLAGLGFDPLLPSILPRGATFHSVSFSATDTGKIYLDVVWNLGTPFTDMHLREMGVPLGKRTDYVVQSPNALQTWQIPGAPQWQNMVDALDTGRLVVGEDRVQFSITLDIGLRGGDLFSIGPYAQPALTYLRLTSLSIDSRYQPLGTISVPNNSMVVHFRVQTVGERDGRPYQWDVYSNESKGESRAALYVTTGSGTLGTLIYTDYLSGGAVARCPPIGLCEAIPLSSPEVANDPFDLSTKVQTFLSSINGDIRYAELWNLGGPQTGLAGYPQTELAGLGIGTTALYALAYVSGPYPITVYVYAATLQVAAVISQINLAGSITPGSKSGQYPLTYLGEGCAVSYPLLVFLDPHSLNLYPDLQAADVGNQPSSMPTVATCSQ